MKVSVLEQVEHSADITKEKLQSWLAKHKWRYALSDDGKSTGWVRGKMAIGHGDWLSARVLAMTVEDLAKQLKRKPSELLSDIAEGR